jgi:uracil-DNA glycosylase family 4
MAKVQPPTGPAETVLARIQERVVACERCPRLTAHCREVARVKRRAYRDQEYWGKPVPSFGDPAARLLIVGLAPGAHGANRTGRMFTGDRSGDFLYRALYETGFASQPTSTSRDDGLRLRDCYITAAGHCAPPDNKPLPEELAACRPYLEEEIAALPNLQVVVALGRIAHDAWLQARGLTRSRYPFGHAARHDLTPVLIDSFHPSQQNTSTGRLTLPMLIEVFDAARRLISRRSSSSREPGRARTGAPPRRRAPAPG